MTHHLRLNLICKQRNLKMVKDQYYSVCYIAQEQLQFTLLTFLFVVTEPKSMQPMNQVTLNISNEKKILQEPGKTESSSTVRLIPIRKHDDDDDEAVTDKIIPDRSKKPIKTQPRPGLAVNGYSAHSHNQQLDDDTISEKTRKGTMKRSQSIPNMSKVNIRLV